MSMVKRSMNIIKRSENMSKRSDKNLIERSAHHFYTGWEVHNMGDDHAASRHWTAYTLCENELERRDKLDHAQNMANLDWSTFDALIAEQGATP